MRTTHSAGIGQGAAEADRATGPAGFATGDKAVAVLVLWASGRFDTLSIAAVLGLREDAVCHTLHMARDGARIDRAREGTI